MSIDATRWAWQQTRISPAQKLVLLSMADRAGEDHRCWPSNARLCSDTGLDRKTVYACIEALEALGIIRTHRQTGRHNIYELVGVCGRESTPSPESVASAETGTSTENGTSAKTGTSPKSNTSPKNGTKPVPKTALHQSQKRDTNLSRTKKESPIRARVGPESPARKAPDTACAPAAWERELTPEEVEQNRQKALQLLQERKERQASKLSGSGHQPSPQGARV